MASSPSSSSSTRKITTTTKGLCLKTAHHDDDGHGCDVKEQENNDPILMFGAICDADDDDADETTSTTRRTMKSDGNLEVDLATKNNAIVVDAIQKENQQTIHTQKNIINDTDSKANTTTTSSSPAEATTTSSLAPQTPMSPVSVTAAAAAVVRTSDNTSPTKMLSPLRSPQPSTWPAASMAYSVPGAHRILGLNTFESSSSSSSSSSSWAMQEEENGNENVDDDISIAANGIDTGDNRLGDSSVDCPPFTLDLECAMSSMSPATRGSRSSMLEQARRIDYKPGDSKLAIAVPINENEDERGNHVVLDTALEYSPHEDRPKVYYYQRRSFQAAVLALFCILGVGGAVGGAVAAWSHKQSNEPIIVLATSIPTMAPTAAPTAVNEPIVRARLDASIAPRLRSFSPQAYESALGWLAASSSDHSFHDDDPMLFQQRFVLAWLWYHTTKNGQEPWLSCNPPPPSHVVSSSNGKDGESEENINTCVFQNHVNVSNDGSQLVYTAEANATRWLSNTHECTWPGIYCHNETARVWAISLRGTWDILSS
jgi:hypothetical protein